MPRLYSPSLPGTPILGRTIVVPVPFRPNRPARIQPRLILLVISVCALLGLAFHPSSPAKSVLPATLLGHLEEVDLVTESRGTGWGWFKDEGRETVLVTGGAGQLGQALIPRLMKQYNVHILDIAQRPKNLPISPSLTYHKGSIDSVPALTKLFAKTRIDGIIHLAGISLEEWCITRLSECNRVNVGGTKSLLDIIGGKRSSRSKTPWMVLASSMDVFSGEQLRNPTTSIGQTKLAAELAVENASEMIPDLRTGIVRMDEIYGYDFSASITSTFIPSLIINALTGLPIQYSSSRRARDYIHVNDAVDGFLEVVERVQRAEVGDGVILHDLISGIEVTEAEVVDIVRRQTNTLSPIRDLASGTPQHVIQSTKSGGSTKTTAELETGLANTISNLISANEAYNLQYLNNNCPTSPLSTPKVHEADERNKDLSKLDGCTVNIGFNHAGTLHHLKCEDGKNCIVDGIKVPSYNWNQSVFVVHKLPGKKEERRVRIKLEEEKGMGWLGLSTGLGKEVGLELYGNSSIGVETAFDLEVASDTSYLRLLLPGTGEQIHAISNTTSETNWFTLQSTPQFDMRMTVLCCPSEGDWPLLLDDHESADIRFGTTGQIPFNSSRRLHLCDRASEAVKYESGRKIKHQQLVSLDSGTAAKQHTVSGRPNTWALRDLPPCWNDCDAPTICVQTGSCRCVQADNCVPRRDNPLATRSASSPTKGDGKLGSHLGSLAGYSPVLANAVAKVDWRDVLLPHAREAIIANPEFIKLHVADGYKGQTAIESAECHQLQSTHCFSADSILYKAMRHISVPADQADLVVLPVYQHCTGADFMLHDVMAFARETIPGVKTGEKPVSVVMTHDWGICIAFAWEIWSARHQHSLYPDSILDNTLVWSVMGDYDSPCYRPSQDVVIPARTCRSIELKEHFPTVETVKPMRERPNLMTWSGTYWGTGKSERLRLTCGRGGAGKKELIPGGGAQDNFAAWDYMNDLSNARFCPQPRGIAGWSPRVNDAIFSGCIPVLTAEGTHYPFASFLDWSKFSVRIAPTEMDNIEAILAAIPLEKVEEMQANLVAVREAFIYSTDEKPEEELERRGPMFFALHEAGLRLKTKYPVKGGM